MVVLKYSPSYLQISNFKSIEISGGMIFDLISKTFFAYISITHLTKTIKFYRNITATIIYRPTLTLR